MARRIGMGKQEVERFNNGEKDKTRQEKYAERWWTENGYSFKAIRLSYQGTTYYVQKDGIGLEFKVYGDPAIKSKAAIDSFIRTYNLKVELQRLRKLHNEKLGCGMVIKY